jgi:hypothetical protein
MISVDLPAHGLSPRDHDLTVERAAAAVVETVSGLVAEAPVVAIGHSFGGVAPPPPLRVCNRASPCMWMRRSRVGAVTTGPRIPGAAHPVWYSHFDEFVASLPEVFQ